ncbi:MAG: CDP-alcohol phosphatidyltransferase family protein [Ruminococcus flavefaciens]|nr:CDP-alcohol phosphatidyltransferase family protein [Ruminococcus flavefaciens]
MIGYYNYTVILTYMSLVSSVLGMFFAMGMGGSVHPEYAIMCLMISGLCDMFDGKVARTKKDRTESEKQFGIQIDSLCDAVCFGVLPSVIGYSIGMTSWCDVPVLVMFPLCAVIRLAYFNVNEEERQKKTNDVRKVYEGLPVTSVALILPVVYAFHKEISPEWFPTAYGTTLLLIAIAFITPFKLKKPTMKTMLTFIVLGALELAFMMYKTKTR